MSFLDIFKPSPIIYKCCLCRKTTGESLKMVQSHVLVCGYYGSHYPDYYYHPTCLKKYINLEDGYRDGSKVDLAIDIIDSIKMWQSKKAKALQNLKEINTQDL